MIANALTLPWDIGILTMLAATGAIVWSAYHWMRKRDPKPLLMKLGVALFGSVALASFLVIGYGSFIEPQIITVTTVHIPFGTPESLRMAVVSDLHVGPYKGAAFIRRMVKKVNALQPDVVLLLGDLVLTEEVTTDTLLALQPLADLHPLLGTYAIMGNHDHSIYRMGFSFPHAQDHSELLAEGLSSLGISVLRNTSVSIQSGENIFAIAGIEEALSGKADIVLTFEGLPKTMPTVLMSHNPDVVLDSASLEADIIVSGHTHGGQIRLPWYGPIATLPTHLGRAFDQGIFQLASGATLAITRGIGESGPRARLFAPPEILLIETVPSEATLSI